MDQTPQECAKTRTFNWMFDWQHPEDTELLYAHVAQHGPAQWELLETQLACGAALGRLKWHVLLMQADSHLPSRSKLYSDWELCALLLGHQEGAAQNLSKMHINRVLSTWLPGRSPSGIKQAYAVNAANSQARMAVLLQKHAWPANMVALLASWPGPPSFHQNRSAHLDKALAASLLGSLVALRSQPIVPTGTLQQQQQQQQQQAQMANGPGAPAAHALAAPPAAPAPPAPAAAAAGMSGQSLLQPPSLLPNITVAAAAGEQVPCSVFESSAGAAAAAAASTGAASLGAAAATASAGTASAGTATAQTASAHLTGDAVGSVGCMQDCAEAPGGCSHSPVVQQTVPPGASAAAAAFAAPTLLPMLKQSPVLVAGGQQWSTQAEPAAQTWELHGSLLHVNQQRQQLFPQQLPPAAEGRAWLELHHQEHQPSAVVQGGAVLNEMPPQLTAAGAAANKTSASEADSTMPELPGTILHMHSTAGTAATAAADTPAAGGAAGVPLPSCMSAAAADVRMVDAGCEFDLPEVDSGLRRALEQQLDELLQLPAAAELAAAICSPAPASNRSCGSNSSSSDSDGNGLPPLQDSMPQHSSCAGPAGASLAAMAAGAGPAQAQQGHVSAGRDQDAGVNLARDQAAAAADVRWKRHRTEVTGHMHDDEQVEEEVWLLDKWLSDPAPSIPGLCSSPRDEGRAAAAARRPRPRPRHSHSTSYLTARASSSAAAGWRAGSQPPQGSSQTANGSSKPKARAVRRAASASVLSYKGTAAGLVPLATTPRLQPPTLLPLTETLQQHQHQQHQLPPVVPPPAVAWLPSPQHAAAAQLPGLLPELAVPKFVQVQCAASEDYVGSRDQLLAEPAMPMEAAPAAAAGFGMAPATTFWQAQLLAAQPSQQAAAPAAGPLSDAWSMLQLLQRQVNGLEDQRAMLLGELKDLQLQVQQQRALGL